MSLRALIQRPMPVTAPLVLNPLMARMAEAAGFPAGYLGGGSTGYQKVALEANLNVTELMAAKVKEAVAARRNPDFLIVARTNAIRASSMDDALRRGDAYRTAGADLLLLSMAHKPEQLRAIGERLGGPLMYLAGRGGLAGLGLTLADLGSLGYKIVADPSTPLLAAYVAWKKVYAELADGFGANVRTKPDWSPVEKDMLTVIDLEKLLAIERATVEDGTR